MSNSYPNNLSLQAPLIADRDWDSALNSDFDQPDGMTAIGSLVVTCAEVPSSTLNVRVSAGTYIKSDGTLGAFAGAVSYTLSASTTTYLWLTDDGILTSGAAFLTTSHVRLALVVTNTSTVSSIVDERIQSATSGTGFSCVLKTGDTITGTPTGAVPGMATAVFTVNASGQSIGFIGIPPASQAPALAFLTDNSTGEASNTIVDVGPTFAQGLIVSNFATSAAKVNALITALNRHGLMST